MRHQKEIDELMDSRELVFPLPLNFSSLTRGIASSKRRQEGGEERMGNEDGWVAQY